MSEHKTSVNSPFKQPSVSKTQSPSSATTMVDPKITLTAVVYCEGNFGEIDGKTANGLIRHSEKYRILSVIDSEKANQDAGEVLGIANAGIPIYRDLKQALESSDILPDYFIFGMAPSSGKFSESERTVMLKAIDRGLNILNGLHEFLNDDPGFVDLSEKRNVQIIDVRRPPGRNALRSFSGRIKEVSCPRIAVLGTDCAIGKRTTARILCNVLRDCGLNAVMISTGQTGLMQGARYGIAMDSIPSQFCIGELEATIFDAFETESPDVIIIEGQSALSHPAYSTSSFILRGSCPDAVILQHAPKRKKRCDFSQLPMPTAESEIHLIQAFSDTKVIGLTINSENMSKDQLAQTIFSFKHELGIPAMNPLTAPSEHLIQMVISAFPELKEKVVTSEC